MAIDESILAPYVNAETLLEAERELDRLTDRGDELPAPLGDLYDELAEHAADQDDYDVAARLERKAIDAGCTRLGVAREMYGWYLLKAGATIEGEAVFAELCAEAPDDPHVRMALGHARSDAGRQDAALDAFDEALAAAKRRGFRKEIDRARIERRAEREHFGLEPDEEDALAPAPISPPRSSLLAIALAWFPPDQREAALRQWPDLTADFEDPRAYARRLEEHLRVLDRDLGQHPSVAPIDVGDFLSWAVSEGYDPGSGEARSAYAVHLKQTGRTIAWPPGRNDACWCRSGRTYKRCCGAS